MGELRRKGQSTEQPTVRPPIHTEELLCSPGCNCVCETVDETARDATYDPFLVSGENDLVIGNLHAAFVLDERSGGVHTPEARLFGSKGIH
jgi:hypothetical protein